jgi:hypothetical protein
VSTGGFGWSYRLWSSADGVHWHLEKDRTGPTSDRSTVFPNPLRSPRRWTFSIKGYDTKIDAQFGRSRLYLLRSIHMSSISFDLPLTLVHL